MIKSQSPNARPVNHDLAAKEIFLETGVPSDAARTLASPTKQYAYARKIPRPA
ncbi:MAG: hypothetical protein QOJ54_3342 [Aliidongia sp.]|nr:hypothetical protein [Aliidongia sp.]